MLVNEENLQELFPKATKISELCSILNEYLPRYEIDTKKRVTHFLSQVAAETGFVDFVEKGTKNSFKIYDDRFGNTEKGDGYKYRGRGLLHLTFHDNYRDYGKKFGEDLINDPDKLATDLTLSVKVSCQYWVDHGANQLADKDDLFEITRRINGGYNGLNRREKFLSLFEEKLKIVPNPEWTATGVNDLEIKSCAKENPSSEDQNERVASTVLGKRKSRSSGPACKFGSRQVALPVFFSTAEQPANLSMQLFPSATVNSSPVPATSATPLPATSISCQTPASSAPLFLPPQMSSTPGIFMQPTIGQDGSSAGIQVTIPIPCAIM